MTHRSQLRQKSFTKPVNALILIVYILSKDFFHTGLGIQVLNNPLESLVDFKSCKNQFSKMAKLSKAPVSLDMTALQTTFFKKKLSKDPGIAVIEPISRFCASFQNRVHPHKIYTS